MKGGGNFWGTQDRLDELASEYVGSLNLTGGVVTASSPVIAATQTWNSGSVLFNGVDVSITDTASDADSILMRLAVDTYPKFIVRKNGETTIEGSLSVYSANGIVSNGGYYIGNDTYGLEMGTNRDVKLAWGTANTLVLRNSTNGQTFRVYNTYTDAANYEFGFLSWTSNLFRLGTQKAGTGVARSLYFATNGSDRWGVTSGGSFIAVNDATNDFGSAGANRARDMYLSRDAIIGGELQLGGNTNLLSEAANIIAMRNGVNSQTLKLYETYTNSSNYAGLIINGGFSGEAYFQTTALGTGTLKPLTIYIGPTATWRWDISGHYVAVTDNTFDIGASGANRPRNVYVAGISRAGTFEATAGTTARAQINLVSGVAPTTPANGDIWFDGTDLKIRIGGVTRTVTVT